MRAQSTTLAYVPITVAYSAALDRLVLASASPNTLHILNPSTLADTTVALSGTPSSVSIDIDGLHAAVGNDSNVDYVDLQTGTIKSFPGVPYQGCSVVLDGNYVFCGGTTFNLTTGNVETNSTGAFLSGGSASVLNATGTVGYNSAVGIQDVLISSGTLSLPSGESATSPLITALLGALVLSSDGSTLYSSDGSAFSLTGNPVAPAVYIGGFGASTALALSSQMKLLAASQNSHTVTNPGTAYYVQLYDTTHLNPLGRITLPAFAFTSEWDPGGAQWLFFNRTSGALYAISETNSASDSAVQSFIFDNIAVNRVDNCSSTLSYAPNEPSTGGLASAPVNAAADCTFTATSSVPWIVISSYSYAGADSQVQYMVRPNLSSSPRTGTISIGAQSVTVHQAAQVPGTEFLPLSFNVAGAAYSKALDKLVLVSSAPDELHILDPVTQADQVVPLSAVPLAVSVDPTGNTAAVGHYGSISVVDLPSATISSVVPVNGPVPSIVLGDYGYAYSESANTPGLFSVNLSSGAVSLAGGGSPPLFLHPSGKYLYDYSGVWEITSGPATEIAQNPFGISLLGAQTLAGFTEDGTLAVVGTTWYSLTAGGSGAPGSQIDGLADIWQAADSSVNNLFAATALIPSQGTTVPILQFYAHNAVSPSREIDVPPFSAGDIAYEGFPQGLFWNSAEDKLFVLETAYANGGTDLLSSWGVATVANISSVPACAYSLSAPSTYLAYGFLSSLLVDTNCAWIPIASTGGLSISYGTEIGTAQIGSGLLSIETRDTTDTSVTIAIGSQTETVVIEPSTCTYSSTPNGQSFDPAGGSGSISVTTQAGCAWSAQSPADWIQIDTPMPITGSGSFQYTVLPMQSLESRYAVLQFAGAYFNIDQTAPTSGSAYAVMEPCRVVDTRTAAGPFGGPSLSANEVRSFTIPNSPCGIPADAAAYALNVTVVPHGTLGYLTIWPDGVPRPEVSTLNSLDGRIKANAAIVPASSSGTVDVFVTDDTDVVIDVNGFFGGSKSSNGYFPVSPCRIADTRAEESALGGPWLIAGQERDFPVLDSECGLPYQAAAFSLNVTAVPRTGSLGYLTVWPSGNARPVVSTLNALTGTITANAALMNWGGLDTISLYGSDDTDVVIDTNGYFQPDAPNALGFTPVTPCRVFDSRKTGDDQPFAGTITIPVAGACGVPSSAAAYVVNATVVPNGALGYLTLWPAGESQPVVSTLNALDGEITSNMAIVPAGAGGAINAYATTSTHLVIDISGYFAP